MKCFLLLAAFLSAASAVTFEDVLVQEYNLYKAQFGKSYETPDENFRRMQIFLEEKYEVAKHNLKYQNGEVTYEMEINKFSDWLPEELENLIGMNMKVRDLPKAKKSVAFSNVTIPNTFSWVEKGVVSPVGTQGSCNSGYAFSALGALEAQYYIKKKKRVILSKQQIIDCSWRYSNEGCKKGYQSGVWEYIRDMKGVNTEAAYPYEGKFGNCRYDKYNVGATCTGFKYAKTSDEDMKRDVFNIGPLAAPMMAISSLRKYKSGVYSDNYCNPEDLAFNHHVLIVGYGTDPETKQDYWLAQNSWGTDWGEKGYFKIIRRKNMCGIELLPEYPTI